MTTLSASNLLAHFVGWRERHAFAALPTDVVEMARHCFMDWIAVAIAAADEPLVRVLVEDLADGSAGGSATLLGRPETAGVLDAILINGAAGHALDYDDGNAAVLGHATVGIAPAVLALAEQHQLSGRKMIEAFVAGYEMAARIGTVMTATHYRAGFHGTATMGTFGAAGAAAALLQLDDAQTRHALALAGTRAAGLRASFGSMAKPLHPAHAAWVGATAARWAARGFTGADDIFADERGFLATHAGGTEAVEFDDTRYLIRDNRFKWHAACHLTHGVIDAAIDLRKKHAVSPEHVQDGVLRVPANVRGVCDIVAPENGLQIKFSLPMVVAFALHGIDTAAPASFTDGRATDPALNALRERLSVVIDEKMRSGGEVTLNLTDGRRLVACADPLGSVSSPDVQGRAIGAKFDALVAPRLGDAVAVRLRRAIERLDEIENVAGLVAELGVCAPPERSRA